MNLNETYFFLISYPDFFIGLSTTGANMNESTLWNVFQKVLNEVQTAEIATLETTPVNIELMVHPGYKSLKDQGGCGAGPDDFSLSADRELEMNFLKDKFKHFIQKLNIQLQ